VGLSIKYQQHVPPHLSHFHTDHLTVVTCAAAVGAGWAGGQRGRSCRHEGGAPNARRWTDPHRRRRQRPCARRAKETGWGRAPAGSSECRRRQLGRRRGRRRRAHRLLLRLLLRRRSTTFQLRRLASLLCQGIVCISAIDHSQRES
jgi:hypothetical protein